jgi:DNA-binding CsgD family transcriptional regulator
VTDLKTAVAGPVAAPERLLEREDELEIAAGMASGARVGSGATLLVEGPAGIGKSALIGAIRAQGAAAGFSVLTARGAELEREFSFGVVRQLFEPVLRDTRGGERRELLAGAAALAEPAVGRLHVASPSESPATVDPSFAVLHGLYWLSSNLAERAPVLIAVDDAHWADLASLRFLDYLAGRLDGLRVMLAVGLRPFEPGAPEDLLAALAAEQGTRVLKPAPLSEASTESLIHSRLGAELAPGFAHACHRASGGNPQLIRELLAVMLAEGVEPTPAAAAHVAELRADRIAASVLARLGGLGESAVAMAQVVAVLGRDASPELVGTLAEVSADDAEAALEALRRTEILLPKGGLAFSHPIVRSAVYNDLPPSARGEAHWRAARLLADRGADSESVAAQIVAAPPGGREWAVAQLLGVGQTALARGAPDAAVSYLERALVEEPGDETRREILVGLGRGHAMLGEVRPCVRCLYESLELTADARRRAEIVQLLIAMLGLSRSAGRGVELLRRELEALPDEERELGARLEGDIDSMTFFSLDAMRAAEGRRKRFETPEAAGSLATAAMIAAVYEGPAARGAELAVRAWEGGRLLAREAAEAPIVWMVASALLYSHELSRARAVASEWTREASRRGSLRAYSLSLILSNRVSFWLGDLAEAEADARAFVEGWPEAIGLGSAFLSDILTEQGRLDEAERALAVGHDAGEKLQWSFFYPLLLHNRGTLAARQGRLEQAHEALLDCGRAVEEWGVATPGPLQWRVQAAEVLMALGEPAEARRLIDDELESCREFGSPRALGIALRGRGLLEGGGDGIETLRESASVLARSQAKLEHARSLVALGAALRRGRRAADAREPLREGLAIARSCGAIPLAEEAHEELTATGARPRKIVRGGAEALTATERRVAGMAAGGMANKEIAQELFVTVRTVEAHLHHAYQKLDISSRGELAGALAGGDSSVE